jgi:putative Holliday junction resolvase
MPRSLGLDIGNRRIGVAISDASKLIARPLGVIDRKNEDALARLSELLREYAPDEIVIGMPYRADGGIGEQAQAVQAFAETLRTRTDVPLSFYDERFSSQEAQEIIASKKRKQQPVNDDALAASVILQRYLDERPGNDGDFDSEPP